MPLQATSGAASYDAFGGGVPVVPQYIEDMFSTYLYDGNDTARSIVNGIDLSTKGGLVWVKGRNLGWSHNLYDTVNGVGIGPLNTSSTAAPNPANNQRVTAFNTDGFSLGTNGNVNGSTYTYASWTFRKQPKFFDVVTYTGTGASKTIAHSLGSTPGCIITKRTDSSGPWAVGHRGMTSFSYGMYLNTTGAEAFQAWFSNVGSTSFDISGSSDLNVNGGTYVAYIFAHDAGGFGLTGTDNVISCGSTNGSKVTLGWEPQWILYRSSNFVEDWQVVDNMRGLPVGAVAQLLKPNISGTDTTTSNSITIAADGFTLGAITGTAIYIAIRRGPMKVPTDATKVFVPVSLTPSGATNVTTNFPSDMLITTDRAKVYDTNTFNFSRLVGSSQTSGNYLRTNETNAEVAGSFGMGFDNQTKIVDNFMNTLTAVAEPVIYWNFKRAPSFFDEVCYTGTGADPQTVAHNLGKAPELMIFKARDVAAGWRVWGGNMAITEYLALNETSAVVTGSTFFGSTLPTATSFYVGSGLSIAARTIVAYLFATCAGVSKVGSYTGTGATQTIACDFVGGARFVLVKRTDSTGDWYVWDTARGMVVGTDPSLLLNSTAAEVNANSIYTATGGFQIVSTAAGINASGGSYIFLAIA